MENPWNFFEILDILIEKEFFTSQNLNNIHSLKDFFCSLIERRHVFCLEFDELRYLETPFCIISSVEFQVES